MFTILLVLVDCLTPFILMLSPYTFIPIPDLERLRLRFCYAELNITSILLSPTKIRHLPCWKGTKISTWSAKHTWPCITPKSLEDLGRCFLFICFLKVELIIVFQIFTSEFNLFFMFIGLDLIFVVSVLFVVFRILKSNQLCILVFLLHIQLNPSVPKV